MSGDQLAVLILVSFPLITGLIMILDDNKWDRKK
jgi:hypothetical protein